MLAFLDRITDRTAYIVVAAGFSLSVASALLTPQESRLGRWVQLVIWHGMLKWACIIGIFAMGVLALVYLINGRAQLLEWARAMQVTLLPMWVVAVFIGAWAAKLVWNSWNLTERRMTMSIVYIMVAAVAMVASLILEDKPKIVAALIIITSLTMAVGLSWISLLPAADDVHPASAVMSSDNMVFKAAAAGMFAGCIVWVMALVVPVRHWLQKHSHEAAAEAGPVEA